MGSPLQLLILESAADAKLAVSALERANYSCAWQQVQTRKDLVEQLERQRYDLVLADCGLPDLDGITALQLVRERGIDIPFIVCSANIGTEALTEVFRAGATDYLSKTRLDRLPSVVDRALQQRDARRRRLQGDDALQHHERDGVASMRALPEGGAATTGEMAVAIAESWRREADAEALLEVATRIQGTLDLDEILDRVHRSALAVLPCDRVHTFGWSALGGTFELLAVNASAEPRGADADAVEGFPPELMETWAQHWRSNAEGSGMPRARALRASVKHLGGTAFLSAPLNVQGSVGGVMVAAREGRQFDAHSVQLFERIVQQVAVAMTTIEVYRARDDDAQLNAAMAEVGYQLIAGGSSPDLLDRLCRVTTRVLSCSRSYTALWEPKEDAYVPVASHGYTAEEQESLRTLRLPRVALADLLGRLERHDVVPLNPLESGALAELDPMQAARTSLLMALRRGREVEGIHIATFDKPEADLSWQHKRVGRELATLASLAIENIRLVEELKTANRLKSDFVATMSHELRSPLNCILGYTDLLIEDGFGPVTIEQQRVLCSVRRSGRRLLDLVNATLDVSRLDAGTLPVQVLRIGVSHLIAEIEADTLEERQTSGLRFIWEVPADLPMVETDRVKLKVVLMNLIGNAIKFTPHGSVTVSAAACEQGIEIAVSDTGIGMAPEIVSVIFEPFRQGDGSSTRVFGGVGLGLYIVRRLLDLVSGTIDVESRIGGGTTFRVRIPPTIAASQAQKRGPLAVSNANTLVGLQA